MGVVSESEHGHGHGCKNHPLHDGGAKGGVCPSCLRERLSRLCSYSSATAREAARVAPSCSSSLSFSPAAANYYSSASSSNSASPAPQPHPHRLHKRNGSEVLGSLSFIVRVGNGLKKSRSIAFVPRNLNDVDVDEDDGKKKKKKMMKKGFWSKLLRIKGNKKDVLRHSSSMRIM